MTEKRYFKKMWEEEFYIFDSNIISESDFEEKLEYQGYKAFEDSMMGDEVVNRLNKLNNENKELKSILQDIGLIMTNEEVKNVRDEISSKLIKPLCEENGFDVDVNTENGFTIIPKGVNNDRE